MWEVYVNYGIMYGISYTPAENAVAYRNAMKAEIESEFEKNRLNPSEEFICNFARKYELDIMNSVF